MKQQSRSQIGGEECDASKFNNLFNVFVYFKCNKIKRYIKKKKIAAHMPHTEKREMSDTLLRQ